MKLRELYTWVGKASPVEYMFIKYYGIQNYMYRSYGFRIDLTRSQARHISKIRDSQRFVYNWAVERLLTNPTLTTYDLSREFTKVRRSVQ
ncbi:MAG: helix-turn-helix domain-containing protein [Cenarchaeum sp. SB0663_bin_5]|nr:helix-turn-helix domain-containing protein [Cenarchaeum sp. SB0663_bin_5]